MASGTRATTPHRSRSKNASRASAAATSPPAGGASVGSRVQGLPDLDRALVLGRIAEGQQPDGRFSPADLAVVFTALALPPPSSASNALQTLKRAQFAVPVSRGQWRLTPRGRDRCGSLITEMEAAALHAESKTGSGAFLGGAQLTTVPPWLASPALLPGLHRFLDTHPFERNVFAMTRFPDEDDGGAPPDPVRQALEVAKEACRRHGLEMHLASDRAIYDDLWTNVLAHMWASRYGLAFFEDRAGRKINYNMTIEVGGMLMTGRRCALLRDHTIDRMPTDLVGHIYKAVDFDRPDGVATAVHDWLRDDLALGSCPVCAK